MPALRELFAEKPGPQTSLNRVIGQDRTLALIRSSLDPIKEVAYTHDATETMLLSIIAGACAALLRSRGEPIDGVVLPIFVPVSLRRDRSGQDAGI